MAPKGGRARSLETTLAENVSRNRALSWLFSLRPRDFLCALCGQELLTDLFMQSRRTQRSAANVAEKTVALPIFHSQIRNQFELKASVSDVLFIAARSCSSVARDFTRTVITSPGSRSK